MSRLIVPFCLILAALPATANTIDYTFTKIADSTQGFTNFFGYDVNDSGMVAFNSNGNVFVTNGVAVTPTGLTSGWWPSINNAGTVAFLESNSSSVAAYPFGVVATAGGGSVDVSVNNLGIVAYTDGVNVYEVLPGQAPVAVAQASGVGSSIYAGPSINDSGAVAYDQSFSDGTQGVFVTNGGVTTTIALSGSGLDGFEQSPSINNSGMVVFSAATTSGRVIEEGNGGAVAEIAEACTIGCDIRDVGRSPDINDSGEVVFDAILNASCGPGSCTAIETSLGGPLGQVIENSDPLFGSTVSSIGGSAFDRPRINNAGQIVFAYTLADGESGLALATPHSLSDTPEPASCLLLLAALAGCAAKGLRRAS